MADPKDSSPQVAPPPVQVGDRLKAVLAVAYRARRPVLLEGPTGIGKSEIVRQVAAELNIRRIVLDLSLLEPADLVGLPVIAEGRTTYAAPAILPTDGAGILMLEELNRAERFIQQPALQLLTERRLHEYELPGGWVCCAAINPERERYQVSTLDPALRARFLSLRVTADREAWLDWAEQAGLHPAVIQLGRTHDRMLEDVPPRSWTYVSELLRVFDAKELADEVLPRDVLGGYLPSPWVEVLIKALASGEEAFGIDIPCLLRNHGAGAKQLQELVNLRQQGRTDVVQTVAFRVQKLLEGPGFNALIGRGEFSIVAFEDFLQVLPGDCREALQSAFGRNPMAGHVIGLKPAEVLPAYPGSQARQVVIRWNQNPLQHHRILALVHALCLHLDHAKQQNPELWRDMGLKGAVGQFLADVSPGLATRLSSKLSELGISPLAPNRRR